MVGLGRASFHDLGESRECFFGALVFRCVIADISSTAP